MVTFEQIQAANATIRTTDIKGKEYAEVNQRIKAFRMVYPDGFIMTKMESNENGVCVFTAEVGCYDESGDMYTLATGTAYEKESSSFINKTSYIENCETSAVGRALGMAGFGIDTSVASYEEVSNAIRNQNAKPDPVEAPPVLCPKCGKPIPKETIKGKVRTPEEILEKMGCCLTCWNEAKNEVPNS